MVEDNSTPGAGTTQYGNASADMMSPEATRHVWSARLDHASFLFRKRHISAI